MKGETISVCSSSTSTMNEMLPSTCAASGMPRLAALPYPLAMPQTARSPCLRWKNRAAQYQPAPIVTTRLAAKAASSRPSKPFSVVWASLT